MRHPGAEPGEASPPSTGRRGGPETLTRFSRIQTTSALQKLLVKPVTGSCYTHKLFPPHKGIAEVSSEEVSCTVSRVP